MKICIVGKNSYIGNHLDEWLNRHGHSVFQLDVLTEDWSSFDYSPYDAVVHVAGIVHRPDCHDNELYRRVNTEMPAVIADRFKSAKKANGQKGSFVFLSTMAVFGVKKRLQRNVITEETETSPKDLYGQSKLAAEIKLGKLVDDALDVIIVRPPNVYGKGCRGKYISGFLSVAQKLPIIPQAFTDVKQSMIYIDNLCEFIRLSIEQKRQGIFMPQDDTPVSAVEIIKTMTQCLGKKIPTSVFLGLFVRLFSFIPIIKKAYGGVEYDMSLSRIEGMNYALVPFPEAMNRTIN